MPIKVLFVCLGNICRSPTAQGIFQHKVKDAGLEKEIHIDSAGTGAWHIGKSPDSRTLAAATKRGYDFSDQRARQVGMQDFEKFDYVLAMDNVNLRELRQMAPSDFKGRLDLFLNYGSRSAHTEVPDPYYGGDQGFDLVLDLVEDAAEGLLAQLEQDLAQSQPS